MDKGYRCFFILLITGVCVLVFVNLSSSDILLQTNFEKDNVGKIPQEPKDKWNSSGTGFEIVGDKVKSGKKSLGMLGGGGDQSLGAIFETKSQLITTEFWLFVDGVERSLTVFVQELNSGLTDWAASGPYVNWIGDKVRHYPGAWEEIGNFPSGKWLYTRLVVNIADAAYDIYYGDTTGEVYASKPKGKGLKYRTNIAGPPGKVCFGTYGLVTKAYVDDLVIYEGDVVPKGLFAVSPQSKMAVTWGNLRCSK